MTIAIRTTIEKDEQTFFIDSLLRGPDDLTDDAASLLLEKAKLAASNAIKDAKIKAVEFVPPDSCQLQICVPTHTPQKMTWNRIYYKLLILKEEKGAFYMGTGDVACVTLPKCPLFLSFEAKQSIHKNMLHFFRTVSKEFVYDISEITPTEFFQLIRFRDPM